MTAARWQISLPYLMVFLTGLMLSACTVPPASMPAAVNGSPRAAATVEYVHEDIPEDTAPVDEPVTGACRSITHVMGVTEICDVPQRIVVLEWTYAEDLLAVGVQPVGMADIAGYNNWVRIPVELAEHVVDVGTRQDPNLETMAALAPDLIIAVAFRVGESYAQLSTIAPTLVFDPYPTDESITQYEEMRQTFLTIADVVGRKAEAEQVLAGMEQTFADARARIRDQGSHGDAFVLAQAFGNDTVQIRLFTDNAMATQVVEELGLTNAWQDGFQMYGFATVSVETLPDLGDIHFFYVVQDDNDVFAREAIRPLWENLSFVRNGHAYPLGGDTWLFGGPLSAQLVAEIVANALLSENSDTE